MSLVGQQNHVPDKTLGQQNVVPIEKRNLLPDDKMLFLDRRQQYLEEEIKGVESNATHPKLFFGCSFIFSYFSFSTFRNVLFLVFQKWINLTEPQFFGACTFCNARIFTCSV